MQAPVLCPLSDKTPAVVCRTENDKKGGHLAKRKSDGQFILRESAQCAKEDEASFQNTGKHKFFNTNNLWVRCEARGACFAFFLLCYCCMIIAVDIVVVVFFSS